MIYTRLRTTGVEEDVAMTTHHFYAAAGSWPSTAPANYETAETVTADYWTALKNDGYADNIKLSEMRWYREDDLEPPWGPPARVTGFNLAGFNSSAKQLPPQVAIAVTEYTGLEERQEGRTVRHWGRFYLPAPCDTWLNSDGAITPAAVNAIADATDTWYAGMTACGLVPAVRITGWGGTTLPDSGWAPVKEIRVDNLFDTIRRRRYETVSLRVTKDTFAGDD